MLRRPTAWLRGHPLRSGVGSSLVVAAAIVAILNGLPDLIDEDLPWLGNKVNLGFFAATIWQIAWAVPLLIALALLVAIYRNSRANRAVGAWGIEGHGHVEAPGETIARLSARVKELEALKKSADSEIRRLRSALDRERSRGLAAVQGPPGPTGPTGPTGPSGATGPTGVSAALPVAYSDGLTAPVASLDPRITPPVPIIIDHRLDDVRNHHAEGAELREEGERLAQSLRGLELDADEPTPPSGSSEAGVLDESKAWCASVDEFIDYWHEPGRGPGGIFGVLGGMGLLASSSARGTFDSETPVPSPPWRRRAVLDVEWNLKKLQRFGGPQS